MKNWHLLIHSLPVMYILASISYLAQTSAEQTSGFTSFNFTLLGLTAAFLGITLAIAVGFISLVITVEKDWNKKQKIF